MTSQLQNEIKKTQRKRACYCQIKYNTKYVGTDKYSDVRNIRICIREYSYFFNTHICIRNILRIYLAMRMTIIQLLKFVIGTFI